MVDNRAIVHLVRHGEVRNPDGVLYGRLPDFHLSDLGRAMARRVAEDLRGHDIVHLRCSPLERAQETMEPLAAALDLPVTIDGRVIEAGNQLEGRLVTPLRLLKGGPKTWWLFRNPLSPSWGEPYTKTVARMRLAMKDAADAAIGHEAVIVSHQLPIWMVRSHAEHRHLFHDPRRRQCSLASLTSLTFEGTKVVTVTYSEPAADLIPVKPSRKLVAGA